jgi:hypothetical protein
MQKETAAITNSTEKSRKSELVAAPEEEESDEIDRVHPILKKIKTNNA